MDEKNNPLNELVTGLGAVCEMAGLMRENLIKRGFTREEACDIVKEFIVQAFKSASGPSGK